MRDLTVLADEIHTQNVVDGWWDNWDVKASGHETAMIFVVSEMISALEGDCKGWVDDHLPKFNAFDVGLADAMIRLLDLAGAYEIDFSDRTIETYVNAWVKKFTQGKKTIAEQLYMCVQSCASVHFQQLEYFADIPEDEVIQQSFDDQKYRVFWYVSKIMAVAKLNSVDLWKLVELKLIYNKERETRSITRLMDFT